MPQINDYRCNKCGFKMPSGYGGYGYVEDDKGKRIPLSHPGHYEIEEVLGKNPFQTPPRFERRVLTDGILL